MEPATCKVQSHGARVKIFTHKIRYAGRGGGGKGKLFACHGVQIPIATKRVILTSAFICAVNEAMRKTGAIKTRVATSVSRGAVLINLSF